MGSSFWKAKAEAGLFGDLALWTVSAVRGAEMLDGPALAGAGQAEKGRVAWPQVAGSPRLW